MKPEQHNLTVKLDPLWRGEDQRPPEVSSCLSCAAALVLVWKEKELNLASYAEARRLWEMHSASPESCVPDWGTADKDFVGCAKHLEGVFVSLRWGSDSDFVLCSSERGGTMHLHLWEGHWSLEMFSVMAQEGLCEDPVCNCPAHPEERKARENQKGKFASWCQPGAWPGSRELERNVLKTGFLFFYLFGFSSFFKKINSREITVFTCRFSVFKKALK